MILRLAVIILMIIAVLAPAYAHEWYPIDCCSGHDCDALADDRVERQPAGYMVDGQYFFPNVEVRPSQSGRYHACFPNLGERPKCFFAPPDGS